MSEHTPTPWRIDGYKTRPTTEPYGALIVSDRGDGFNFRVALCAKHPGINTDAAKANAAFIVMAVNSHDALVEALATIADIAEGSGTLNSFPNISKIARAAIASIKVPA